MLTPSVYKGENIEIAPSKPKVIKNFPNALKTPKPNQNASEIIQIHKNQRPHQLRKGTDRLPQQVLALKDGMFTIGSIIKNDSVKFDLFRYSIT